MSSFSKSPWLIHYDASSCNGCDIETLACLTPLYDVERLGVLNTGNPKHADIFVVTGAANEQSQGVIRNIYHQLAEPKVVVAVGACASSGGIFRQCYNIAGGVDHIIPVDVYVPGCAARPEAIIDGVVKALGVLEQKRQAMLSMQRLDEVYMTRAQKADAPALLALQKIAYRTGAEIYGDDSLPVLQQTLEELQKDFEPSGSGAPGSGQSLSSEIAPATVTYLKAVVNGKIIGAIRGEQRGQTAYLSRLVVHPYFQQRGIGARLLREIESAFPEARQFQAYTGSKNEQSIKQLRKLGYREFKNEVFTPTITWTYLQKECA